MAKKIRDPSMPLYVADWFGSKSIALMTLEEEGGFLRLLLHAWSSGDCSLVDDDQELSVLSRLGQKWFEGSGDKIRKCFRKRRGKLVNEKLASFWNERRAHAEQCRLAGVRSGEARRSKANDRSVPVRTEPPTKTNSSSSSSSSYSSSISMIDVWLRKVKPETIADLGLLLLWFRDASAAGALDGSDFTRDRVAALALRCRARGKNPPGLFVKLVREGAYHHANFDEFEAAVSAIHEHLNATAGPSDAEVAAALEEIAALWKPIADEPLPKNVEPQSGDAAVIQRVLNEQRKAMVN